MTHSKSCNDYIITLVPIIQVKVIHAEHLFGYKREKKKDMHSTASAIQNSSDGEMPPSQTNLNLTKQPCTWQGICDDVKCL